MKRTIRILALLSAFFTLAGPVAAQQPAPPAAVNPLASLEWLVGKWTVTAPVPGGAAMLRESFFEWGPNRKVLRFWSYVTPPGRERTPYVDGWYFWDPADKKIRFAYVDPGAYYEGEVSVEAGTLNHIFTGKHNDGRLTRWRYTLKNEDAGMMPTRIYAEKEGQWSEIVFLTYQKQK